MLVNKNSIEATLLDFASVGENIEDFSQEEIDLIFKRTFEDLATYHYQWVFKQNCLKVTEERENIYKINDVLNYLQSFNDTLLCKLSVCSKKLSSGRYMVFIRDCNITTPLIKVKECLDDIKDKYGNLEVFFNKGDLKSLKIITLPVESYLTLV
jgi:hypothetical protein